MNKKIFGCCISIKKDLNSFLRRFALPAAVLCAIAAGAVGFTRHSQRAEDLLTEADILAAMQQTGLPLELSEEGTELWREGHVLYTLTGENIQMFVSCVLADGERILQMNCLSREEEMPEFSLEDWRTYLSFALILFDGDLDSEALYKTLSYETMTEIEPTAADAGEWTGLKILSWKGSLSTDYGAVTWRRYGTHITRTFPSPVVHRWENTLSVSMYESEEVYEMMHQPGP